MDGKTYSRQEKSCFFLLPRGLDCLRGVASLEFTENTRSFPHRLKQAEFEAHHSPSSISKKNQLAKLHSCSSASLTTSCLSTGANLLLHVKDTKPLHLNIRGAVCSWLFSIHTNLLLLKFTLLRDIFVNNWLKKITVFLNKSWLCRALHQKAVLRIYLRMYDQIPESTTTALLLRTFPECFDDSSK
jgi:hypothetical protein